MVSDFVVGRSRLLIAPTLHVDPTFFLHHAVCPICSPTGEVADLPAPQMIDKVWYDWQCRDPSNKNAFAGGTVSWQANSNVSYAQYPTGGPPFLNVRGNSPINAPSRRGY